MIALSNHSVIITGMKYIPGFNELYAATEDGRIWSYPKSNPLGYGTHHNGKFLSPGRVGRGYLQVNLLCADRKYRTRLVHRLVAETFIPNPDDKPQINHKNGNKEDNRVENLEWCTNSENLYHSVKIGTYNHTRKHSEKYMKKVSHEDVERIIELYDQGVFVQVIADEFGISRQMVSYYKRRFK